MTGLDGQSRDGCQAAVSLLEEAARLPRAQLMELTTAALRKVVGVRDALIERLREQPGPPVRASLDQINVALTELASVEYPEVLERSHIETAQSVLCELLASPSPRASQSIE